MAIPAALRFKRSLQLVGLLGMSTVAVLISVRTPAGIQGSGFRSLAGLAGLQNGTVVEVSAFANSAGELVASHIEAKAQNSGVQVVGPLQALDAARQTFRIKSLVIDYHSAQVEGVLAEGTAVDSRTKLHLHRPLGLDVAVRVTGTFDANGVLVASKVKDSK